MKRDGVMQSRLRSWDIQQHRCHNVWREFGNSYRYSRSKNLRESERCQGWNRNKVPVWCSTRQIVMEEEGKNTGLWHSELSALIEQHDYLTGNRTVTFVGEQKDAIAGKILEILEDQPLESLMLESGKLRDIGFPKEVTFSPKVFIPVTRLCRDKCGYCTFAQPPVAGRRCYMTKDEILDVAKAGAELGCCEALLTLGDKPELVYPEAALELENMGYGSTLDYVYDVADAILRETGLLPHINAGVMSAEEIKRFKRVSASQGLMVESLSMDLMKRGRPHFDCPDKLPIARIETLERAGAERVPFTTGILIGIGETRLDRLKDLLTIKAIHQKYGHIQEVIIQNFRAKKGTDMQNAEEPSLYELLWTICAARLILGPRMSIQSPPNLTPSDDDVTKDEDSKCCDAWTRLIHAGINDWGGVSPLTRDFVNPEMPWPHLQKLSTATADAGKHLVARLPVNPSFISDKWLDSTSGIRSVFAAVNRNSNSFGLYRASCWYAGTPIEIPKVSTMELVVESVPDENVKETDGISNQRAVQQDTRPAVTSMIPSSRRKRWHISIGTNASLNEIHIPAPSNAILRILDNIMHSKDYELSEEEIEYLFSARGADFEAVTSVANKLREKVHGNEVTYVVNRNINYTNVSFGNV